MAPADVMMRRQFTLSVMAACTLFVGGPRAASRETLIEINPDSLPSKLPDLQITFCAIDLVNGMVATLNGDDIHRRHAPWSSFKIPNLIIALETGGASGLDHRRRWDRKRRPDRPQWPPAWRRDHTLETAFRHSVPWYFQDIAQEIGSLRYRVDLARFGYGNVSIPDNSDSFWLGGPLEISPWEQMQFLNRLVSGSLSLKPRTWEVLQQASITKADGGYVLHGKTGSGPLQSNDPEGPFEGWFVGWVQQNEMPSAVFALHVTGSGYRAIRTARIETAEALLVAADLLPRGWK